MSFTQTRSGTLTTTWARVKYVTRKVQADLLAILDTYGYYTEEHGLKLIKDLRVLLDDEVIWRVDFVWAKKGTNEVIESLSYSVVCGDALPDNDAGDILYRSALSASAASFSVVIYRSQRWKIMQESSKQKVRERLELNWEHDADYDYGLERKRFVKV